MVKHIVMWNIDEKAGDKAAFIQLMKDKAVEYLEKIEGVLRVEIGAGYNGREVVLCSEHESRAALEAYYPHPLHEEYKSYVTQHLTDRAVIDCEFD